MTGRESGGSRGDARAVERTRVLVIDDEPMMGTTLRVMLADRHDVTVVTSAKDAMDLLAQNRTFDAILCDLMLPGVSGMELYRWLGDHAPEARAHVVFMTGGAYTDDASEFLERVGSARIDKPFGLEELTAAVDRAIARPKP